MTEKPEDGAKEAVKIVSEHWDKLNQQKSASAREFGEVFKAGELVPTTQAFLAIRNLDEEKNAEETLQRLEEVIAPVFQENKRIKLINEVIAEIQRAIASEVDLTRKKALKKLERLFADRYAI